MKVIYFGKKVYLRYQLEKFPYPLIHAFVVKDYMKWEHISMLELDTDSVHEVGQTVFFPDLNKDIKVVRVSMNVNGGYVYWMDHTVELVEDEETEASLIKAEAGLREFETRTAEYEKEYNERFDKYKTTQEHKKTLFEKWFS